MTATLVSVLAASLLGSAHCAAMCGGFVCFYATDARQLRAHALYNGGRLVSYVLLGLVAGVIGSGITHAATLAGIGRGAAIVSGSLMIIWGAAGVLAAQGIAIGNRTGNAARRILEPRLRAALELARGRSVATRALTLGLVTTLLPCGWLYVFVVAAAATGSPLAGGAVMTAFWLGTLPAMVAVGIGAQRIFGPLRQRLPMLGAAMILVIGLLTLTGRLAMTGAIHGH